MPERGRAAVSAAPEARNTLDQVARLAADRRAGGLLLTEPEGNPDPLLEQGRTEQGADAAGTGTRRGESGGHASARGAGPGGTGQEPIQRQAAAREQSARDIPLRRAEAQALRQATASAQAQSELQRSFARESYANVAANLARARELQGTADGFSRKRRRRLPRRSSTISELAACSAGCSSSRNRPAAACWRSASACRNCAKCGGNVSSADRTCSTWPAGCRGSSRCTRWPSGSRPGPDWKQARSDGIPCSGQMESLQPHWPVIQQQMAEAAAALKQAEELARQDLQLADRAAAEIDAAGRELARVQGFFQLGVSADVTQAEALLGQARLRLAEQAYEAAIDQAGGAQRTAQQAYNDAVQRVQQEQQRADQERQRLAAATAVQYASPPNPAAAALPASWPSAPDPAMDPPVSELGQAEPPPGDSGPANL